MVVAVEVTSWTRLCSVLVFVINCLVTSSICCLIRFVILFAVVELSVFLFSIKSTEAHFILDVCRYTVDGAKLQQELSNIKVSG